MAAWVRAIDATRAMPDELAVDKAPAVPRGLGPKWRHAAARFHIMAPAVAAAVAAAVEFSELVQAMRSSRCGI